MTTQAALAPVQHSHHTGLPCHPRCRRWGMSFWPVAAERTTVAVPDEEQAPGAAEAAAPLVHQDPPWMLLDHRWDESWTGCEHCRQPIKRVYLIEESATGRRLHVGKSCLRKFGIS